MIPHLSLRRGLMEYFIFRAGDEFHIIDCDMALTHAKRNAILERGLSAAEMQQMGLSGMTIPISHIRSLHIAGTDDLDRLVFRLRGRNLVFRLNRRYTPEEIDAFFRDVPRRRWRGLRDWRTGAQDPELYRKLRRFGWVWNIFCALIGVWFLFREDLTAWGSVTAALCVIAVVLESFFPDYFSLFIRRKKTWFLGTGRKVYLSIGLLVELYLFTLACRVRYHLFEPLSVLPAAAVLTLLIGLVLYLSCREFSEEPVAGLVTMLLVLMLCCSAFIPHFNHVLRPKLRSVTGVIVDTRQTMSRYSDRYFCTVQLPDGREVEVSVSWQELEEAKPGDTMELQIGTGFFGIDYAMDTEGGDQ